MVSDTVGANYHQSQFKTESGILILPDMLQQGTVRTDSPYLLFDSNIFIRYSVFNLI